MDLKSEIENSEQAMLTTMQWHSKLGHLNFSNLRKLPEICDGVDNSLIKCNPEEFCENCITGKLVRKPFKTERQRARRQLEILHTDVCGKVSPATYDGEEYFLTILDDFTHFVKVYLLHTKNEEEEYIMNYVNEAEAHFNVKTEKIRCDRGGEYRSQDFQEWCKARGIILDYTIPHTPELNGKAERLNLTLMNKVRPMLTEGKLDNEMWGFAVLTAAYQINRSPSSIINTTPYEMWTGKRPNLKNLQIFGSTVYTKNLQYLKKLDDRGQKGIFVGYALNGYRVMNPNTRKIYVSRDIKFTNMFKKSDKFEEVSITSEYPIQPEEESDIEDEEEENREENIYEDTEIEQEIEVENGEEEQEEPEDQNENRRPRRVRRLP